jgi:LPXTG-motif cell wall-anchored protein
MKHTLAVLAAVLVLASAGPSAAQQTLESVQASPLYKPSPALLGEVSSMNSHSVTVRTAREEEMVFEFDSRTVMPMTMPPGLRVKIEFHLMENGMHHAGRITRLEPGSLDWQALDKQLAFAEQERARQEQLAAEQASEEAAMGHDHVDMASNESQHPVATGDDDDSSDQVAVNTTDADNDNDRGVESAETELPQTASPQPWLLVLGAAATSFALGLGVALRRKHA